MVKFIAFLTRKPGMSLAAFMDYYETRHEPLIRRLLPHADDYRRNYMVEKNPFAVQGAAPPDFDVVTEVCFHDSADFDKFFAIASQPEVAAAIARDEENFLDRSKTHLYLVDERCSQPLQN